MSMPRNRMKYYDNVWEAGGYPPAEAANMQMRSRLMLALEDIIEERGLTQKDAATLFGVSQPRVSDLVRGQIDKFSLDALVQMLHRAGYTVSLTLKAAA